MSGPGDHLVDDDVAPREASGHGADGPTQPAVWRLDIVYEGTAFRGWARQPGLRTVQGILEEALGTILREPVRLSVAGRTDTGVHALAQVASFACSCRDLSPDRLRRSLNALLPPDVAVTLASAAAADFVARRALSRTYRYRLVVSPVKPVLERAFVWRPKDRLDVKLLGVAAALLPGRRDFAALTPSAHLYRSCVREVTFADWRRVAAEEWVFEIRADSFLHNMVRVAVGSMVDVAQGRMTLAQFETGLAFGRRPRMGQTAPARGLALVAVEY
jgi:tRNA pseudouridine38-40 synthase